MCLLIFIKPMTKLPPLARRCLSDIDLRRTYRVIDSVAIGRTPLFCGYSDNLHVYITSDY